MTRGEALAAFAFAFLLVATGLTWLLGPYGLIISGLALAAAVLFGVRIVEERRAEPVPDASSPRAFRGVSL